MSKRTKISILVWTIFLILLIGIPSGFIYVLNHGNPYHKYMVDKYIPSYLEEQGYTQNDFKLAGYIDPKYLINKDYFHGHYEVVFKDEPNITYFYGVSKSGHDVKQFCETDILLENGVTDISEENHKHTEDSCVRSLHNRD